jgi:hypothetical protein
MSVSSNGIQALNFIGRLDRKDEMLILNQGQQQAVLKRLLKGRDDELYQKIYGTRFVRDVVTDPRNVDGKNRVMPFWN